MPAQGLSGLSIEFLQQHAPFNQMLAEHQAFLAERLTESFFGRDTIVTGPEHGLADRLYIIKQGRVRGETQLNASSDESVWELVEGESFPVGALLAQRKVQTWHRAVEDTYCYELSRDDFETLLNKSQVFHDFCTRRLANLLGQAISNMQANTATSVSQDSSLNTPIRELLSANPISCLADTPLRSAMEMIEKAQRRSIAIVDEHQAPIGILTLRDVMVRVTLPKIDIESPIKNVMTPVKACLTQEDFAYEAALIMAQSGFGHVCVVDKGRFVGLLSERDLFSLQRVGLGNLSRAIQRSNDIQTLKHLATNIAQLADQMMAQGASVTQLMRLITTLNDLITQRVILICENECGKPPVPYSWLAFGSEGRMEQTLKTDQDNGILFETDGTDAETLRQQFLPLAQKINAALAEVGFTLCPGNIMASNPECCLSKDEWQSRFARWIETGTPENLLNASIFFDYRVIHGQTQAADKLRLWLNETSSNNSRFRHQMAANALRIRPPLGFFRDFVTQNSAEHPKALDIKLKGITPFVDIARIYALATGSDETNTIARIKEAAHKGAIRQEAAASWIEAYQYLQLLRMRNHRQQAKQGRPMSNFLAPDELNELERRILKEAFRQARTLQTKLALDYQL